MKLRDGEDDRIRRVGDVDHAQGSLARDAADGGQLVSVTKGKRITVNPRAEQRAALEAEAARRGIASSAKLTLLLALEAIAKGP